MKNKPQTRDNIVQAAMQLFHSKGYDAVGVNEICQAAGVAKGSFYHFFPTKNDVALAVVESWWLMDQQLRQSWVQDFDPLTRLRMILTFRCEVSRQIQQQCGFVLGCPFGRLIIELGNKSEALRLKVAQVFDENLMWLRTSFSDAVKSGQLEPNYDIDSAANLMLNTIQGIGVIGKVYNDVDRMDAIVNTMFKTLKI
ncbi:MAG: TetR/AcrR family transcriptional regulator [Gammaproteobacteria bacterium]|nr:TetR/AcrR family transcriptional regulator [Gammaproteobacteria bacterium]MDH5803185.1 TetR/AcrR family transcriptional regulator [Gammaproteobacteria bacterium]